MATPADAAVHVVAAVDRVGLEEAGDRRGRRDGLADRHLSQLPLAEHDALSPVDFHCRNQERALERVEGVREAALGEALAHEALERREVEEARGKVALGAGEHVGHRAAEPLHRVLADRPDEPPEPARGVAESVGGVHGVAAEVQGIVEVLVDDAEDLGRSDAVGEERRHDRARTAADVDVEPGRAVEALLERRDRADLVHPPDDAAPRERKPAARALPGAPEAHRALQPVHVEFHCSKRPARGGPSGNSEYSCQAPAGCP